MPDRYQSLLQTAHGAFLATGANYPAAGKDAKPVLQDSQKTKIETMVNGPAPSLYATAGTCGQVMAKAEARSYADKDALEADAVKAVRLLKAQTQALGELFQGFKREETAWIKQGATLSWDARAKAMEAQRAAAKTFLDAVAAIESEAASDLSAAVKAYPSAPPHPGPGPEPTPTPRPADIDAQRDALVNAALNGVPCVAIDPDLKPAA